MTPAIQALLERVRDAGLLGSASGEPTHTKLRAPCDVVIANAAAAEPMVRSDTHLLTHYASEVIKGLKLAMQATNAKRGAIALKRCDHDAKAAIQRAIQDDGFAKFQVGVVELDPYYPAGEHEQLVEAILGDRRDRRHVVFNVMTLFQIGEAQRGQSVTRRLVTLTGAVNSPKTIWAPLGTPFERLLELAGGPVGRTQTALLAGGPMRGRLAGQGGLGHADATLVWLPEDHPLIVRRQIPFHRALRRAASACHQCQRCTEICPPYQAGHSLRPHRLMLALQADVDAMALPPAIDCTACQLCTFYACPHELAPGALIAELGQWQRQHGMAAPAPKRAREQRRVPLARLAKRLGLYGLDHLAPFEDKPFRVKRIELDLCLPNGVELVPQVRPGDRITYAQIVARPKGDEPGVPLHSSLSGVVRSVEQTLVIEEIG